MAYEEAYTDCCAWQDFILYSVYGLGGIGLLLFIAFGGVASPTRYPENLIIVDGEITHFEPFFDGVLESGVVKKADGPLSKEGVVVSVTYTTPDGEQRSLKETWMLPCVDHFKLGDTVPVIWFEKKWARSVVLSQNRLNESLELGRNRKTLPEDSTLKDEAESRATAMLEQYDKMFRLLELYEIDFEDESTTWEFAEHYDAWRAKQAEALKRRLRLLEEGRDGSLEVVDSPRRRKRDATQTITVSAEADPESYE